jgi:hypothetical protein
MVGLAGVFLVLTALIIGLATSAPMHGFEPHSADGPRAMLCALGLLVTGCAISMRPNWFGGWLCGAAAGLLGYGLGAPRPAGTDWYLARPNDWYSAIPSSWDSIHVFFLVAFAVGLLGAAWTCLPRKVVLSLMLVGVAYHFGGIISAITSPPPTPWLTDQYWKRIARPYLQFAYMNNAYQFYSPDPGPACELWVFIEYKTDDPEGPKDGDWIYIPRRHTHYIDPLGMSFYRRLSITENVAQYLAPTQAPLPAEQQAVLGRRNLAARDYIPRMNWPPEQERRVPNEIVTRQILPSYARHLIWAYAEPSKPVKSVRIYRTFHLITTLPQFRGYDANAGQPDEPVSPYSPKLYLPFFQGEYTPEGKLVDSADPLLYWLVPILEKDRKAPADRNEYERKGGFSYYFTDYVAKHAGHARPSGPGVNP